MKSIILAIILVATTGVFAGQKRRPAQKPIKIFPVQFKSDREFEKYFEDLDLDIFVEELTPEVEAQDLVYNKIIDNVESAIEANEILAPIMLAICGDQKAKRNGQQKYRMDAADITEVAEYNGKMTAVVYLLTLKKLGDEVSEGEFYQEYPTQMENFVNEQVDDCIDGMEDDIRKQYPNIVSMTNELPERFQREVVNRAKTIARDWNFLMDGTEERYWQLQEEESEFLINQIYAEMERRADPKYRLVKGRVAPKKSRTSI